MATITTSVQESPGIARWEARPESKIANIPFGEIVHTGSAAIPAVITTNVAEFILTTVLPRNFIYRLSSYEVWATSAEIEDFEEWQPGMNVLVASTPPALASYNFELIGSVYHEVDASAVIQVSFQDRVTGTGGEHRFFHPRALPSRLIDAASAATITLRWFNNSGNATAIMNVNWHVRLLAYTTKQWNKYDIHNVSLVLPP